MTPYASEICADLARTKSCPELIATIARADPHDITATLGQPVGATAEDLKARADAPLPGPLWLEADGTAAGAYWNRYGILVYDREEGREFWHFVDKREGGPGLAGFLMTDRGFYILHPRQDGEPAAELVAECRIAILSVLAVLLKLLPPPPPPPPPVTHAGLCGYA